MFQAGFDKVRDKGFDKVTGLHVTILSSDTNKPESHSGRIDMQISKRDYFAAQALTGLLSRGEPLSHEAMAAEAFLHADAMLKLSKTLMDPVEIDPEQIGKRDKAEAEE